MLEQKITIQSGRMIIPSSFRKELKMSDIEEATISLENGNIMITTKYQALERLRKLVETYIPQNVNLVDEFIKEKRIEAKRELEN